MPWQESSALEQLMDGMIEVTHGPGKSELVIRQVCMSEEISTLSHTMTIVRFVWGVCHTLCD